MKEVIRLEKREEAVSPVIATILMVAITVVLAATVYILVSHYTSVGATTPLTATLSEISEGGGTVIFSLSLSTPSNITSPGNIHLTVSGPGISAPLSLKYNPGSAGASAPAYWIAQNGTNNGNNYYIVVTFTNTNGIAAGWKGSGNYVASGATMNVYVISNATGTVATLSWTQAGAPSPPTSSPTFSIASDASMSGLSFSMTVSGYSGTATATAP